MEKLKEKKTKKSPYESSRQEEREKLNLQKARKMFEELEIDEDLSGLFFNSIKIFFELGKELTENLDKELFDKALKKYQQKKQKEEKK